MNTEALFLFLILLLGLVLCSFLGGSCNKEGLTNNNTMYYGPDGATATMSTDASGTPIITLLPTNVIFTQSSSNNNLYTNPFGFTATLSNGNLVIATPNNGPTTTFTPSQFSSSSGSSSNSSSSSGSSSNSSSSSPFSWFSNSDNYNHYTGTSSSAQLQNGMVFTDASGDTLTVNTNSNGTQSLKLVETGQSTPVLFSSTSSSGASSPYTFYAGSITATVITGSNGQTAIKVSLPNGQVIIFNNSASQTSTSSSSSPSLSSTQYYGSTGSPIQQGGYSLAYNGPYGGSAGAVTGPNGNTGYYAQGPGGSTVAGTSSSSGYGTSYYSTLPSGIPASQIPPGQEDLYILKSEIVPPVCPACPSSKSCPRQEKCPPCPACARCPEQSFECKKVPNYNAINNDYLPQPVLSDFSQFGM